MRLVRLMVLYAGLALLGNPAGADVGKLMSLATGELGRIQFHAEPRAVAASGFLDANGGQASLADYRGKYVLLNFWALWCAPCVKEMPALNALDGAIGGNFEVVTLATGRNARPAVDVFFADKKLDNLPKLFDPKMQVARDVGALGLPVTLFIDPEGREVARATGDFEWDSPEAQKLITAWISG
ncbi:TlpA disulfide reductase family protein [uncultured Litoreibacter sp.]|uniref:TlpA family protein disulfide reductase n=1 Tax=uncultured Litoreibacter sp. TaxID=1392394 RepID=UPI002629F546|nr:TlpA disulfide reductase family protein [uncultured Litoreibacter sp.]